MMVEPVRVSTSGMHMLLIHPFTMRINYPRIKWYHKGDPRTLCSVLCALDPPYYQQRTEVVMQAAPAAVAEPTTAPLPVTAAPSTKQASNVPSTADAPKLKLRKSTQPLEVHVIGLSHHNAAVDVREKLSISEDRWNEASEALCSTGE